MTPIPIRRRATEGSTFDIPFTFYDDTGAVVTPTTATWTLLTRAGAIVNDRDAVDVAPLASTVSIPLTGDDLALPNHDDRTRYVLITGRYNSSLGNNRSLVQQLVFEIDPVIGLP